MREGIFCMDIIQLNLSVPSKVNYKHKKRGLLQPPENSYNKVKSEMQGFFIIDRQVPRKPRLVGGVKGHN